MSIEYKKLDQVCEILDSRRIPITASDRKSGIYPYFGANGLQDYVDDYIFDDELVLLAEDGGNFGSKDRPIAYRVSGKCWVNNHAHVLKAKDEINIDYLCYSLMFYNTNGLVNGATRQKLTQAAMRQMLIPVRSMPEQLQIVKRIRSIFDLINDRTSELLLLDQLVKSRFIEMFGDPRINPKGYDIVSISSLFDVGSSKRVFESEWRESGVPFYRAREIVKLSKDGYVDNELFIEEEMYEAYKAKYGVPKAGDLMVTGVGTLGVCYIVKETDRFYFKDGNTLWFKNKGLCDVRFIKDQYDTDFVKEQITANANVSTVGTYTITNANNTLVLLPSLAEQEQYVEFCKQVDKSKFEIQKSLDELEILKKSLMQQYFG